jgi:hypothetical protein
MGLLLQPIPIYSRPQWSNIPKFPTISASYHTPHTYSGALEHDITKANTLVEYLEEIADSLNNNAIQRKRKR